MFSQLLQKYIIFKKNVVGIYNELHKQILPTLINFYSPWECEMTFRMYYQELPVR